MQIWLISPYRFYRQVVADLAKRGVQVTVVYGQPDKAPLVAAELRDAVVLLERDVMGCRFPPELAGEREPMTAADLQALAEHEGDILEMIDRLNAGRLPVHALREIWHQYGSFWKALLEARPADAVVFHATPHMGPDHVLYRLCALLGVRTLIVDNTYLDDRVLLREAVEGGPLKLAAASPPTSRPAVTAASSTALGSMNQRVNDLTASRTRLGWMRLLATFLHPRYLVSHLAPLPSKDWRYALVDREVRNVEDRWQALKTALAVRRFLAAYEDRARPAELQSDFVYFPLHYQPERSTVPGGGRFSDQVLVIETLARSLPLGWTIYVKEHPRQLQAGIQWRQAREGRFLERLTAVPNVQLVPLDTPSAELIAACRCVATVSGTSGWEALWAGKPALVFGNPWYSAAPGVLRVDGVAACRRALAAVQRGERAPSSGELQQFLRSAEAWTFRGAFSDDLLERLGMSPQQNGELYGEALVTALRAAPRMTDAAS